jgi:saccharopine dehydrogenase (NAD+, L-lysine-forming)
MVILGGAGAMAGHMAMDLKENSRFEEFILADVRLDLAEKRCEGLGDPRFRPSLANAGDRSGLASILKGASVCVNCAQYNHNVSVMEACLQAKAGYIDLGGLFHVTLKQKPLHEAFKEAGVPALLGMGSTPGTMNVLARYGVDLLDTVERADALCAWIDGGTDQDGLFIPPYALRTIMEEMTEDAWAFEEGEMAPFPAGSGREMVRFPEPIGCIQVHLCLHSEPATWPVSWEAKGIKGCAFKIGMPPDLLRKMSFLVRLGFHRKEALADVGPTPPLDFLERLIAHEVKEAKNVPGNEGAPSGFEVLRARVTGTKDGLRFTHSVDMMAREHSRWRISATTGTPPSIASGYMREGRIPPGVWAPEEVIDPVTYFQDLAEREMYVQVETVHEPVAYHQRPVMG